jgi:hypothetical protein
MPSLDEKRMKRLRAVLATADARKGLQLPEHVTLMYDPEPNSYVLLLRLPGTASTTDYYEMLAERKVVTVTNWRNSGRTLSFVARHALRLRNLPEQKASK